VVTLCRQQKPQRLDAGVRIFTVGVEHRRLAIPVSGDDGQTAFVKDPAGQVVKIQAGRKPVA